MAVRVVKVVRPAAEPVWAARAVGRAGGLGSPRLICCAISSGSCAGARTSRSIFPEQRFVQRRDARDAGAGTMENGKSEMASAGGLCEWACPTTCSRSFRETVDEVRALSGGFSTSHVALHVLRTLRGACPEERIVMSREVESRPTRAGALWHKTDLLVRRIVQDPNRFSARPLQIDRMSAAEGTKNAAAGRPSFSALLQKGDSRGSGRWSRASQLSRR